MINGAAAAVDYEAGPAEVKKENPINKTPTIHKRNKRNGKATKTKNRIKKMIFQTQDRKHIPLSEEHKYIMMNRNHYQ
tara:strand:- start:750 stop:983 length:234 start_codon:yes stop_codon:yes gene_type:complete